MRRSILSLVAVSLFVLFGTTSSGKEGLDPIRMMSLRVVTSVHPSPDGSAIAFVRAEPRLADAEPGSAYSSLWVVSSAGGEERRLIGGERTVKGVAAAGWSGNRLHVVGRGFRGP